MCSCRANSRISAAKIRCSGRCAIWCATSGSCASATAYGRAVVSRLSGEPLLYSAIGFASAARQALTKLGVPWEPTEAERAYNEGRSTQVPVNPVVRMSGRFSRQLRHGDAEPVLER